MVMKLTLILAVLAVSGGGMMFAEGPLAHAIDHIGIGVADLDRGMVLISARTGVTAVKGGVHPGRGTQNALMSIGSGTYLEIIAPAPGGNLQGQDAELAKLTTPRPVFFAIRSNDLEATARLLQQNGFAPTEIRPGSRKRPDGTVLAWRTFGLIGVGLEAAPFFIQWAESSPHPSTTSPAGCTLAKLEVGDKDPAGLSKLFRVLSLDVPTHPTKRPELRATLACPKGEVILKP